MPLTPETPPDSRRAWAAGLRGGTERAGGVARAGGGSRGGAPDRGAMAERLRRELQRERARLQEALQEQEAECEALQRTCAELEGRISREQRATAHRGAQTEGSRPRNAAQQTEGPGACSAAQQTEGPGACSAAQQTERPGVCSAAQQTERPGACTAAQQTEGLGEDGLEGTGDELVLLHESLDRAEGLAVEMRQEAQVLLRQKTRVLGELRDARGENARLLERVALLEGWKQSGELERDRLDMVLTSLEIENEDLREQLNDWQAAPAPPRTKLCGSEPPSRVPLSPIVQVTAVAGSPDPARRAPLSARVVPLMNKNAKAEKSLPSRREAQADKENSPAPQKVGQLSNTPIKSAGTAKRPPLGDIVNTPERGLPISAAAARGGKKASGASPEDRNLGTPLAGLSFTGLAEQIRLEFPESPSPVQAASRPSRGAAPVAMSPSDGVCLQRPSAGPGIRAKITAEAALGALIIFVLAVRLRNLLAVTALDAVLPAT